MHSLGGTMAAAADWSFSPWISLSQMYDSNIRFTDKDQQSDFIATLKPVFSLTGDTELTHFRLDSITTGQIYYDNSNLDALFTDTKASVSKEWTSRLSSNFSARFVRDSTLETQLEEAGLRATRTERDLYDIGAGGKYAVSELLDIEVSGNIGQTFYPDGTFPDAFDWSASATPIWKVTERDKIGLSSSYAFKDYQDSSTIKTLSEVIYWERLFNETTTLRLGGGYRHTEVDFFTFEFRIVPPNRLAIVKVPQVSTDSGLLVLADLKKDWSDRLSTTLSAGRDEYNTADVKSFQRNFARLATRYLLSELTTVKCDVRVDFNTELNPGNEETNYVAVTPSIERKITKDLSVSLTGSYERQVTDNVGPETTAERYRGWLSLNYQLPRLWASH
jgi:hypothetical protein